MKVSDEVMFLEEAFDVLNKRYFESALQKIAITIQSTPRAHGHFTPWDSWDDSGQKIKEINLGAESLCRPVPDVIATLMHEMVTITAISTVLKIPAEATPIITKDSRKNVKNAPCASLPRQQSDTV